MSYITVAIIYTLIGVLAMYQYDKYNRLTEEQKKAKRLPKRLQILVILIFVLIVGAVLYFRHLTLEERELQKLEHEKVMERNLKERSGKIKKLQIIDTTYANGNKYVGEWKDNKMHGQGTYTYVNGDKYVGEFEDEDGFLDWYNGVNLIYGQGTYTYVNGDKYVGDMAAGMQHGQGKITYADGTVKEGEFTLGVYIGKEQNE